MLIATTEQHEQDATLETHPALLAELQALHNTHREATRLCLMAASQGATDAQIAHALRQGLPHFTDPGSLQDQSFGKQPQGIGIHAEDRQTQGFLFAADAALPACLPAIPTSRIAAAGHNHKHARTTRQATQTQPCLLAASLEAIPAEDWVRTWPAGRTIMLRSTSKGVKDVVDKMRLPAVVRLARGFWNKTGNTADQKLEIAMRQLLFMTGICRITTLELPMCRMKEQHAQKLAGVLIQCRELVHLDLQLKRGGGGVGTREEEENLHCFLLKRLRSYAIQLFRSY